MNPRCYTRHYVFALHRDFLMASDPEPTLELTTLLQEWRKGDGAAFAQVVEQVYAQLKRIANQRLREVSGDSTLSPTELLHEAMLRVAESPADWKNRAHFFATMSLVIRSTLVDHARAQAAHKRGGDLLRVTWTDLDVGEESQIAEILALDRVLSELEAIDPRGAGILHLTYFAGLDRAEIANVMGISVPTVDRELRFCRAWLTEALGHEL